MKAVLSVPAWYRQDTKYRGMLYDDGSTQWLLGLGECILRSCIQTRYLYAEIQKELAVEIKWIPDETNPSLGLPHLLIEAQGNNTAEHVTISRNSILMSMVARLGQFGLYELIPECQLRISIVYDLEYNPLGR